mgnify:FL=1|jgi:hypothetical protein|tara:strand:+ start:145 stop:708 length:564 start_codon:yes stop_codon:yes gene_type:complete
MGRIIDTLIVFRILKLLTTPWEKQKAYQLGIIDKMGKRIQDKEISTAEEKNSFDLLHRLVFNLKKIINKVPFGKSAFASYAVALLLLKEETQLDGNQMEELCERFYRTIKDEGIFHPEMLDESLLVGTLDINYRYHLRRRLKFQNETIYPEKSEVTIMAEHSNVFGILVYVGYINEDRVLVTADDIF